MFGASGGTGRALALRLTAHPDFSTVLGYSRSSAVALDLCEESSIEAVAADVSRH